MEQAVKVFMDTSLMMKEYGFHILTRDFYQWQTQDQTPMALSSSLPTLRLLGWMENTQYLVE